MEKKKSFFEVLESEEWKDLQKKLELARIDYANECDDYWNNLSYEDKLKSFFSVVKRIVEGDIEQGRSYRGVLYDVFGFDADSYIIGMECGYMTLHNSIVKKKDNEEA